MTHGIDNILARARKLRACESLSQITDLKSAIGLLLTPQGREFALNTHFPTLRDFRGNKGNLADMDGVFVDAGAAITDGHDIVAVGDTDLVVYAFGPARLYHVMAMHGARVRIDARSHAVVTVTNVGGSVECTNDGTAVINEEKR